MATLEARRMEPNDVIEAAALVAMLVRGANVAEHAGAYGGAGSDEAIVRALRLVVNRPELGFVWLVAEDDRIVALAIVCLAVSTNVGALVAKIPDLVVREDARGRGVGAFLVSSLAAQLRKEGIRRIDLGVHDSNPDALRFYERLGFKHNHEIGLSLVV